MAQPIDVGGFGGEGFVLAAQDIPQPFDGEMQIHGKSESAKAGGTKAVQPE